MKKYGLIGYPLSHSFSKNFFEEKFKTEQIEGVSYQLYPLRDIGHLGHLIEEEQLDGFNVTIPHKINILPFLSHIDPVAQKIGAVNCVGVRRLADKVELHGYNTDAIGFKESLVPLLDEGHQRALILGNGGAAKAVAQVLEDLGIDYWIVSRSRGDLDYSALNAEVMQAHKLIINTTPLGMYPNIAQSPDLPYPMLSNEHLVYDLIYNPEETELLKKASASGAKVKNGLEMLVLQAEASWGVWNNC